MVAWMAVGYRPKPRGQRGNAENTPDFMLCSTSNKPTPPSQSVSMSDVHQASKSPIINRQRVKSAPLRRSRTVEYSSSQNNENEPDLAYNGKRPLSAHPPSMPKRQYAFPHRRVKSAGTVKVGNLPRGATQPKVSDFPKKQSNRFLQDEERFSWKFQPHPDNRYFNRHARCHNHTHMHTQLLRSRPQTACENYREEGRCPTSSSTYRPLSAGPRSQHARFIQAHRPKTASYSVSIEKKS